MKEPSQKSPDYPNGSTSPLLLLPNTYRAFFGGFERLHPFQREAIVPVLQARDLVLQAATGSGKTEAVLAPCMERVIQSKRAHAVLYIVPTRALAVDLERRLTPILSDRLNLQMGIRTGDIKRQGGGRPDLILTTPESFDVLMGSSNRDLQEYLRRVRTVVIDEVHPLLHEYRGKQLSYLLQRLERRTGLPTQKIAVSATIADVDAIIGFFRFRPDAARIVNPVQRDIAPHLVHLKSEEAELTALLNDLHDMWGYRKVLMFANSRGQCDRLFSLLSKRGRFQGVVELHYSNLRARERRSIEDRFRRREHSLCIATSTLELGIDVGDVDGVILYTPPDSATSFLQRIGRSNRRESTTHFWGICRGERAGEQLIRFLGLLRLARLGIVEIPLPNSFPSVLVQQILSCLYQGKRISLAAMRGLFPECGQELDLIFPAMEAQCWLRRDSVAALRESAHPKRTIHTRIESALYRGGWRYRDALLDRIIWSNFPPPEEDYALEVSGETVADLPRSIVRQLDPGDRVHLAGRRIQILQILDTGERKRVISGPADELDDKKILWLGAGFQVSFEAAQAMRAVMSHHEEDTEPAGIGLFERTRRLLRAERDKQARTVMLANGIEVLRESGGFYRYRTYLGSMGNLILRLTIERAMGKVEDFYVTSDEIGITCSHWVDFQILPLPMGRDGFKRWVMEHVRYLRFLLPLNVFSDALPNSLLVEEITGFLYDERVAEHFSAYRLRLSEIVSGDPNALELPMEEQKGPAQVFLQPAASPSLLEAEKRRLGVGAGEPIFSLHADARHTARSITGTMIGEYTRHHQCERWLSFHFLPPDMRPPAMARTDEELRALRTERGRQYEKRVLAYLRDLGADLVTIPEADDRGYQRSLSDRFSETIDLLNSLVRQIEFGTPRYLSQAVLMAPALLMGHSHDDLCLPTDLHPGGESPSYSLLSQIDGIGIPDIIRVSPSEEGALLEVGDIKDSSAPYYSQKWQVAFYALLLDECVRLRLLPPHVKVADAGFVITRHGQGLSEPVMHSFDLAPFTTAFSALFRNVAEVLMNPPASATCHLQEHCTTCPWFDICYREALREEDIQFLPRLTSGSLWKMRQLGLATMEEAGKWFDGSEASQ